MTIIGFMSLGATAGSLSDGNEDSVMVESSQKPLDQVAGDESNDPHLGPAGGDGEVSKNVTPPGPAGGDGEVSKNDTPPQSPPPPSMTKDNFDFGFGHVRRRFTCFNGYQTVMVRDIRECGFGSQRRVVVGGGYRRLSAHGGYSYGGGYATGGGYYNGGGYVYKQPIVRYYKPASRAAVMQAEKRARRAAQNGYGADYGYDNGGYAVGVYARGYAGGYGYGNGGYPVGYGAQMGYGEGFGGGRHHKAKRGYRYQGQAYSVMGGYIAGNGAGYGYDAGYGVGFGYSGTTIHYGPIMTKDGSY